MTDRKFDPSMFEMVQYEKDLKDDTFEMEPISYFKDAWIRLRKNKASIVSMYIILLISFLSIFGPSLNKYGFNDQNVNKINFPPRVEAFAQIGFWDGGRLLENRAVANLDDIERYPLGSVLEVKNVRTFKGVEMADVEVDFYKYNNIESEDHWFGTDYLGRDLWTRMWRGSRVSLMIALLSVTTNIIIGVIYGAVAGYYGGKVDMVLMRFAEIIDAFPQIVIITLFIMYFGTGLFSIIMALVIKGWVPTARMIRSQFLRFKNREYVLAARTLGVPDMSLIFRHILPNSIGPIITRAMIAIPGAIFSESFLAFIGLGLQAPEPSIGVLLSEGQKNLLHFPYQVFFPAILISVLMISFNLFSNGLRDAFDPTMRGQD